MTILKVLALVEGEIHTEERFYEAELYRLQGVLLLALSAEHHTEAETCFHHALAVARH